MKTKIRSLLFAIGLVAALACNTSMAQTPGTKNVISGSETIVIPASSTNTVWLYTLTNGVPNGVITTNVYGAVGTATNLALNVSDYDYVGLTWAFTGTATSTNTLNIYKSFDGGATFEANPSFAYASVAPGAAAYKTNAALDVHGVTTLAFELRSLGTTFATNGVLRVNLKAPRLQTQQAGVNNGSVGTPIAVPNFP